jgi:hypothetical protein
LQTTTIGNTRRTTIDNMKTPTLVPSDIFSIGDNITVVGNSKHRGRVATVQKVGSRCLTVQFHDKNKGMYVDYNDARIIDNTTPKSEEVMGLATIMEQLAITAAIAIKTGEPSQRPTLLRDFFLSLQGHIEDTPHKSDGH